ncbi:AAA family ATPase [Cellulosimicrobium marinum]|uniref:AAA family ATPase n=1 Tax=Cellulosimicrobium marinum TaxID=1638992 RepID=UPI001E4787BA|nr:ATP-binding protein [Cellulosimicrobium marinum]MCB7135134.1 ATP-binding protein [Cellulosimicrobium marinum]
MFFAAAPGSTGDAAHGPVTDDPAVARFLDTFATFMEVANQHAQQSRGPAQRSVADALRDHLGTDPRALPVLTETVSALRTVDADVALEVVVARHGGGTLVGVGGGEQRMHTSFSEIVEQSAQWNQFPLGAVDYARAATGPESERRTVAFGLHLFGYDGSPVAVLQRAGSPRHGNESALEVLCADEDAALALLAELRAAMIEHSVLRGQVVTFAASDYGPEAGGMTFLPRERVPASDVVLPEGTLARVERQVVGVARHRDALRGAGQHLKRGVLLYGPPGTGKTHTVRHLVGESPGTTVVLLAGGALRLVRLAAETARALQPAVVVLEDCDLIAEDRSFHDGPQPLLFEVLDAMDGLGNDADVAFVLTTNRADLLEHALAQRPGRVDLAVEIPLPDRDARRRLFELYRSGLPFSADALDDAADRTDGVTASFVKEAIRRAVLRAAEAGHDVTDADLRTAVEEMTGDAERITRSLLGSSPGLLGALDDPDDGQVGSYT